MKKVNIIGYNFAFVEVDAFSLKLPAIIGFLVHKLIKHVHNPIKDSLCSTRKLIPSSIGLSKKYFLVWKSTSGAKIFGGGFADVWWHLHIRRSRTQHPSTTLFIVKKMNGQVAPTTTKCTWTFFYSSHPALQEENFHHLVRANNYPCGFKILR